MQRIAIVGIGGIFPQAADTEAFWDIISSAQDCSQQVPADRWILNPEQAQATEISPDHVNSIRACCIDSDSINISDSSLDRTFLNSLDPMFQLLLHAGSQAWRDAKTEHLDRQRVGVIIGNIALPSDASSALADEILLSSLGRELPPQQSESAAPVERLNRYVAGLPAGLLGKSLGLGGGTHTLDAACASSLYALKYAVDELQAGRADAMLTGGLSRPDCLYTQMGFSQLQAISRTGHCSPFDHKADGLVVGEGAGILVLKRLDNALRDGDHIYATIAGVGLSNDVGGNLMSPDSEGQQRAMRDAYRNAGWKPGDVDLIECHGTGTPIGDAEEFKSLQALWADDQHAAGCVIGSVKSNIGHLLTAAGAAGLIKVLLAMKHGQLPPTANYQQPSSKIALADSPFRVLAETQDWPQRDSTTPRRAAVSAFGFGGINAHVLLEEWQPAAAGTEQTSLVVHSQEPANEPIAIVGMETHFGPWQGLDAFRQRVLSEGVEDIPPSLPGNWWGVENPDAIKGWLIDGISVPLGRFRIPPAELREMLPQQLLMLQVAANALQDAGLELDQSERLNTGVFIGIGLDLNTTNFHFRWALQGLAERLNREQGLQLDEQELDDWVKALRDAAGPALNANRTMGALGGIVASRVARAFQIGGPSFTLSSEETSGLHALEAGVRSLQRGELNCAIVGAVDLAGDVRAALGQHQRRPYSAKGECRPFDQAADGSLIGEGATALILKRQSDALRDGDRIYALISGMGNASGSGCDEAVTTAQAWQDSLLRACQDANTSLDRIQLVETHGSGYAAEDRIEAEALVGLLAQTPTTSPRVISSVKSDIGHSGAAAGLASIARASLCLHHNLLPALRGHQTPRAELPAAEFALGLNSAQYWLHDRSTGPRQAAVAAISVDGNAQHAILQQAAVTELAPGIAAAEALFLFAAEDQQGLTLQLDKLVALQAGQADLQALAAAWHAARQADYQAEQRLGIVARDAEQLLARIKQAKELLKSGSSVTQAGVYYTPQPLGVAGRLAFVYPGSGNHFHHMGLDLLRQWPAALLAQEAENQNLAAQFANGHFWLGKPEAALSHEAVIFGQVCLGTMLSDVLTGFDVRPDAVIGYSLGETAGLFATRSWRDRDEMLQRMRDTALFTRDLAGPCESVRQSWGLAENETVDWMIGVVNRSVAEVNVALADHPRAYLLIVNTQDECVVGGDRQAVLALVKQLACGLHPLEGVTTVHCEVAEPVKKPYRDLHLFDTTPPSGVSFYSGILGRAYVVNRDSAADSIVNQALQPFDYTKVINAAYADGVRLFIEMGPGNSCTRMIDRILDDRPHLARAVCVKRQDNVSTMMHLIAQLHAEHVTVNPGCCFPISSHSNKPLESGPQLTVTTGGRPFQLPAMPLHRQSAPRPESVKAATPGPISGPRQAPVPRVNAPAAKQSPASIRTSQQLDPAISMTTLIEQMQHTEQARAEAQELFLRVSNGMSETMGQALSMQMSLLQASPGLAASLPQTTVSAPPATTATEMPDRPVVFDRAACMQIAIGSLAKVLGPEFAEVDSYPTRVRLPDEPLMLVDRIVELEGEPRSMGAGRVVTEHDVLADAWYLDGGRIPTCIAVEAGQADLFLSGYLGIDNITKGQAVYRLLDAKITFHDELPRPGQTIKYDIHIEHFFRQDNTWLFRFNFEGSVNGRPVLTMTEGCAGFFSQAELDAGKGIVQTALEKRPLPGKRAADWQELLPMQAASYTDAQLDALRQGDLSGCFGEAFSGLPLRRPVGLPTGRMTLVHRILDLQPEAGRFGLGQITGEADIHPDDWFLTCHFSDDQVMPGTLMYECCLHTLRVYLLRMGWVGEQDQVVYEPIPGEISQLKCRGQVLATTRKVQYRITLKEIGYRGAQQTPYVLADALMFADGRAIVQMNNMSVQLSGLTRNGIAACWQQAVTEPVAETARPVLFDFDSIYAFARGKPSEAFGDRYKVFDEQRVIARLPGPPYQFLDRITLIENCQPWELKAGGVIEGEYDVPADAWYFASDRQPRMPFAILLEIALQPCGWLAGYLGSALTSEQDLSFRNLGGKGRQLLPITASTGTLTTRIQITSVSQSGGMIIQNFDMETRCSKGVVYKGDTYFGFFSKQALADQVGIREVTPYQPTTLEQQRGRAFEYPDQAPYPDDMMRMVDRIELIDPEGGPQGLGFIRGTARVKPEAWFFKAHFYQDPVWPGSLGLESFMQLLKVFACERWQNEIDPAQAEFQSLGLNRPHSWVYRGQILPSDTEVTVQAVITAIDDQEKQLHADGFLTVDGRIIYQMNNFTLTMHG